ncbi:MAG: MBOAT family O-acyltransferase, partial [Lachnospiraceae bacterium]
RGNVEVQKNIISFGVYVSMFPQLIAGPIVKYADIEKQLRKRKETWNKFGNGVLYFIRGLAKKVLLANTIGMVFAKVTSMPMGELSIISAWLGCGAFFFQIYFDFSGYSDMAIGLGRMFGFEFLKNFDYPYIAKSITDFWRRWHISLGTWFREYVYIPLGGNRVSVWKNIRNIFIVWLLTGMWHGASWNFIVWGLYYGLILFLEKFVWKNILECPNFLKHIYSILLIMIGWVFFFSTNLSSAIEYLGVMFGIGQHVWIDSQAAYLLLTNWLLWVTLILCSTPFVYKWVEKVWYQHQKQKIVLECIVYGVLLLLCIAYLVTETYNPFLYFRF